MSVNSDFKNIVLGKVELGKNDIKVKDYIEFKQSNALGRVFTQVKLAVKGKGWLNKKSAKKLVQNMDWKTMEAIHSKSQEILNTEKEVSKTPITSRGTKGVKKSAKKEAKKAREVLKLVDAEITKRESSIRKDLTPLKHVRFDDLKTDKNLGPIFQDYLKLLTDTPDRDWLSSKPIHDHYATIDYAHTIVTTNGTRLDSQNRPIPTERIFADVAKREINFDKIAEHNKEPLANGFLEYLVEGMVEGNFSKAQEKEIQNAVAGEKEIQMLDKKDQPVARKLDRVIDNKDLNVYLMTGSRALIQIIGNMNSFWQEVENEAIEITNPQDKLKMTDERIEFLKMIFPSKEFEPLIEMISVIATANIRENNESSVTEALKDFFSDETLAEIDSSAEIVKLINSTFEKITPGIDINQLPKDIIMSSLKDQTLLEISRDESLGEKFADFTDEFAKMIHDPNTEKQKEYFSKFPSLVRDSNNYTPVQDVAIRKMGYFIEGKGRKYVIENLDKMRDFTQNEFKTLFAEYLALQR